MQIDGNKPKVKERYICLAEKSYEVSSQICISAKFRSLETHNAEFASPGAEERSSGLSWTWERQSLRCREAVGWPGVAE